MFYKHDEGGFKQTAEGVRLKTLVYGEKTSLCEFRLEKGKSLPLHSHPHEQTGFLVSGRLRFKIGDETFEAEPGDSWCIPGDVPHSAAVLEEAVVIEAFSPVREDFLR
jgi:quercetin dioxygenase-like cupin family protein